ncbi:hypothetical protein NSMS1_66680 (plasmid) [Nostoc sp. MS1]|nr:hypothetical protein NSMS1_66680 [Nostoc sp. MS1]
MCLLIISFYLKVILKANIMKADKLIKSYKSGNKNFSNEDLRGQSFRNEDLSGINLSGCDIRGTDFTEPSLKVQT